MQDRKISFNINIALTNANTQKKSFSKDIWYALSPQVSEKQKAIAIFQSHLDAIKEEITRALADELSKYQPLSINSKINHLKIAWELYNEDHSQFFKQLAEMPVGKSQDIFSTVEEAIKNHIWPLIEKVIISENSIASLSGNQEIIKTSPAGNALLVTITIKLNFVD